MFGGTFVYGRRLCSAAYEVKIDFARPIIRRDD